MVDAVIRLMDCDAAVGQVVNVGSEESVTIDELADKVIALTGSKSAKRYISYEEAYGRPFDDMLIRQPDLAKIRGLIGYRPSCTLEQTLRQIIEYERDR